MNFFQFESDSVKFIFSIRIKVIRIPGKSNMSATWVTRAQHEWDKRNTSATWVLHKWHESYTNDTSATQVRHEWKILVLITTPVKTHFHSRYIIYIANERLEGEEQFHSKDCLLQIPRSHAKTQFEKCTTKTELCNGKR